MRGLGDTPKTTNRPIASTIAGNSLLSGGLPMRDESAFTQQVRNSAGRMTAAAENDDSESDDDDDDDNNNNNNNNDEASHRSSLSSAASESQSQSETDYSQSEYSESVTQDSERFDDEDIQAGFRPAPTPAPSLLSGGDSSVKRTSIIEFTGMEAVKEVEQLKQQAMAQMAASGNTNDSPPAQPPLRTSSRDGDDLLRNYMGVLHGGRGDRSLDGMESKISKGITQSGHERSDFILNQSLSDMSVGSRSTRQSRREAVMVAQRINFLEDDPAEMTYTRRIALYLMKRYRWYNPRLGLPEDEPDDECESSNLGGAYRSPDGYPMLKVRPENPSLEAAWSYFEHFTLTRCVYEPKPVEEKDLCTRISHRFQKADKELERAERNENILPTKLYDPIWTPHNQLGDWGIGWGLYFASLRGWMVLCLVAGLFSIPNMVYFSGKTYSGGALIEQPLLLASAICTDTSWVPCLTCAGLSTRELPPSRLAYAFQPKIGRNLIFAVKNHCEGATINTGMVNFGVLLLIFVGLFIFNRYLMKMEAVFDSDEQTAQDYTVIVENPPDDATDPDEWRNFFTKNLNVAHVVAVTVAVDNDDLVKKLVERREKMKMLELLLEPGTVLDMNTLAGIAAKVDRERGAFDSFLGWIVPGIPELFRRIVVLTIDIRGLAQHDYPATKVFVTFETEGDQRRVVQEMAVGSYYVQKDDKSVIKDPKYLFRGEHMLYLKEPLEEPNSYRWISLNERFLDRLWQQTLTTIATFASIFLCAFIVRFVSDWSQIFSSFAISIANGVFPEFAKILTKFEGHSTEAGVQTSMYVKICLFRWVNTAVVITIITPFALTLAEKDGLLTQIYALFFTEIFTMNVFQLADPLGHFMRHVLAPRQKTQDSMNIQMKGLEVELAERYTNMTKIIFLALWYSSIYPSGFFMAFFALFINYFTDRHSLMRTWKRAPPLGPGISEFSRRYFVSTSFCAMALLSSYFWASFPMDNLCENDSTVPNGYWGTWNITVFNSTETFIVTVDESQMSYRFCNQDMFRAVGSFPFIPDNQPQDNKWMSPEQETVTAVFGWTSIGVFVFTALSFTQGWIEQLSHWLWGETISTTDDMRINFSDVTNISAYIPQVPSDVFSYPLFVCDMDEIGEEVIDWRDPLRSHAFYDLTKDAEKILEGIDISNKCVFSQMKHWPPTGATSNFNNSLLGKNIRDDEDFSMSDSDDSEEDFGFG